MHLLKLRKELKMKNYFGIAKNLFLNNIVTISFVILCLIGLRVSGLSTAFYLNDLIARVSRNSFLILALIIPVTAGMGMNFAIVLGAMAGQAAIVAVTHWGVNGLPGFLLCVILSSPLAILLGYLTGKLLNKTKGQEMITSLVLAFFANGVYQLIFLIFIGTVIPMKNEAMVLGTGVGLKNTIDLFRIKYALDNILKWPLTHTAIIFGLLFLMIFIAYYVYRYFKIRKNTNEITIQKNISFFKFIKENTEESVMIYSIVSVIAIVWGIIIMNSNSLIKMVKVPIITTLSVAAMCLFNMFITKTKLGQDFRAVGQDAHVAGIAGIDVNKTRVIAIIFSTLFAAWGQLFLLQNLGTLNTYGSHEQAGMFAIAAILIGGASIEKATISQALLGAVLFHTLFIISPLAGRNLFGDAQIGEFFRAFVVYGVIGLALGAHAWQKLRKSRTKIG